MLSPSSATSSSLRSPFGSLKSSSSTRSSRSSTPNSPWTLCHVCRQTDFDSYTHQSLQSPTKLGQWSTLQDRASRCRFCRLAVESIVSSPSYISHPPRPGSEITLRKKQAWRSCVSTLGYDGEAAERFSNKLDLQSMASRTGGKDASRLVIAWSENATPGEIQYIPNRNSARGDHYFFGRTVDPARIDWDLIRGWLRTCATSHGVSCDKFGKAADRLPPTLRVIDVEERHITAIDGRSSPITYIALSYVWGELDMGFPMPKTTKEDVYYVDGVQRATLPERLPRTLVDAIEVTKKLGFRYLWTDALCIIQDDDQDRDDQVSRMDAIYSCASFTIAAGSGRHADCGLPGVSVPRTRRQVTELVKGLRFAVAFPRFDVVYSSPELIWNTRGWTFQEKILSTRVLLFTDSQVYFRCSNSIAMEDVQMETDRLSRNPRRERSPFRWRPDRISKNDPDFEKDKDVTSEVLSLVDKMLISRFIPAPLDVKLGLFPTYIAIVEEFTVRSFTYQRDVLPAIEGIMRSICGTGTFSVAGLPSKYFLQALLWCPRLGGLSNRFDKMNQNSTAPSWSWASWSLSGGCIWNFPDLYDTEGRLNWYSKGREPLRSGANEKEQVRVILARGKALVRVTLITRVKSFSIGRPLSGGTNMSGIDENRVEMFNVMTPSGDCCGEVWVSVKVYQMGGRHEFVRLSSGTSLLKATPTKSLVTDEWEQWVGPETYTDPETNKVVTVREGHYETRRRVYPRSQWEVENVLLVEFKDDVAYRIGIGKILTRVWKEGILHTPQHVELG